jgi:hypothetical protein
MRLQQLDIETSNMHTTKNKKEKEEIPSKENDHSIIH